MNLNQDYILRMVESLGRFAAKLMKKETSDLDGLHMESLSTEDILPIILKKLLHEAKYGEAEDLLYRELERNPTKSTCDMALSFYKEINAKSDEELEAAGFPREEIVEGLTDLGRILRRLEEKGKE
ncbi:MAG TPA: DUF6483 family protein [Clostridiaceae bacterium]|nr:DUF6483 family protein [Clostridiaceae bacterium]